MPSAAPVTPPSAAPIIRLEPNLQDRERMLTPGWTQARITVQGQTSVVLRARAQTLANLLRTQEPSATEWASSALSLQAGADPTPMPGPPVITIELLQNGQAIGRLEANGSWTRWSQEAPGPLRRITRPTREEEFLLLTDEVRRLVP